MNSRLKDISAHCGLSVSTVSKALNGYPDVSVEARELVHATAAELGYMPNMLARALKTNRTYNLGVLFVDDTNCGLTHNYFSSVLQSFKSRVEVRGYDITFISHHIGNSQMTYLEHCMKRRIDGVCLACVNFSSPEVLELVQSDLPVVTIDHVFNNRTCIQSENRNGMRALVRYIYDMGHRRIAYIHGQKSSAVNEVRLTSFMATLGELGLAIKEGYIVAGEYNDPHTTRIATQQLLDLPEPPTCIIMPDDYASIGGMDALRETGLRVPDDISIAGYDGIQLTQLITPPLTTVRQDTYRIGIEAANHLIMHVENPRATNAEIVSVPSQLMQGDTVREIQI